jgi:protein-S-isoprenylcysteine O-methyltransferase Ste14
MRACFQVFALAVTITFAAVIADIRKKPGMTPFLATPWLMLQKAVAVATLGMFGFILVRQLTTPDILDWLGVVISAVGTGIAAKGKRDLAESHAWAGYFRTKVSLVRHGIYSRLRNPIYCGIFLYIVGGFLTALHDGSWPLKFGIVLCSSYLVTFLLISARRERELLRREFGTDYEEYASETRAFVPSISRSKLAEP